MQIWRDLTSIMVSWAFCVVLQAWEPKTLWNEKQEYLNATEKTRCTPSQLRLGPHRAVVSSNFFSVSAPMPFGALFLSTCVTKSCNVLTGSLIQSRARESTTIFSAGKGIIFFSSSNSDLGYHVHSEVQKTQFGDQKDISARPLPFLLSPIWGISPSIDAIVAGSQHSVPPSRPEDLIASTLSTSLWVERTVADGD